MIKIKCINTLIKYVLGIFCLAILSSCAFGTREILLKNTSAAEIELSAAKNRRICFNALTDERKEGVVGHVKTTSGKPTAEVIAINDVADWVNSEISIRLKSAGYIVNYPCNNGEPHEIFIKGRILKVYTTADYNYQGEVIIEAKIGFGREKLFNKTYSGYKIGNPNWAASGKAFKGILEISLRAAVSKLVSDIDKLDADSTVVSADDPPLLKEGNIKDSVIKNPLISKIPDNKMEADHLTCPDKNGAFKIIKGNREKISILQKMNLIKSKILYLYKRRAKLNPNLSGRLCVHFSISSEGFTKGARIIKNSLNDKIVEDDLIRKINELEFFRNRDKYQDTEVTYSLKFETGYPTYNFLRLLIVGVPMWLVLYFTLIRNSNYIQ